MAKNINRRQLEKIWNILQEIQSKIALGYNRIEIPVNGGWILKLTKEHRPEIEISGNIKDRLSIFRNLAKQGYIKNLRMPKEDGFITLKITASFQRYYRNTDRTYQRKAKAYRESHSRIKTVNSTPPPKIIRNNDMGYLVLNKNKIKIGRINSRKFLLIEELVSHFAVLKTSEEIFKKIQIGRDSDNSSLNDEYRSGKEKIKIIRNTIKEVQRTIRPRQLENNRLYFEYDKKRGFMVYFGKQKDG